MTNYIRNFSLLIIQFTASHSPRLLALLLPPQTLDNNPVYTEEEMKEYEQHLANEANDINKKSDELQKQRAELERKQEELNAQKMGLQQVS